MDDADGFILFVVGSIIAVALFFGVVTGIKKAFKPQPQAQTVDSSELQRQQRQRAQDVNQQQKRLMEDYKQKSRDYRRLK